MTFSFVAQPGSARRQHSGEGQLPPVAAIDLGATSGRVMLGVFNGERVELETVHRFPNGPRPLGETDSDAPEDALAWDIDELWKQIVHGLQLAFQKRPDIASIGIDSWAVDYALLAGSSRLGEVRHYRDPRNQRAVAQLEQRFDRSQLFEIAGLQFLPFNTVYQLEAERADTRLAQADVMMLVPDYIAWKLTGTQRAERTNASTTGLLDVRTGSWNEALAEHLGVAGKLPQLIEPGESYGALLPEWAHELGASGQVSVTAVASHDTASAVAAVPMTSRHAAYVSCGTWGLVGVELDAPVVTEEARRAGFTNEVGIDHTIRFLKNVTGTWLLSESIRFWNEGRAERAEEPLTLESLIAEAQQLEVPTVLFDAADERFLAPGNLPERIGNAVVEQGGSVPETPAAFIRLIIDSLAASFARETAHAAEQAGFSRDVIHIVGGGSQGELLCQRTADLAGVPVIAGPIECTALGNVLVQLRSLAQQQSRTLPGWSRNEMRELIVKSLPLRRYNPQSA